MGYDMEILFVLLKGIEFEDIRDKGEKIFILWYYDLKKNHIHILAITHLSRMELAGQLLRAVWILLFIDLALPK